MSGGKSTAVRAFLYERGGRRVVEYWHVFGEATLKLPDGRLLEAANVRTFETEAARDDVKALFAAATIEGK